MSQFQKIWYSYSTFICYSELYNSCAHSRPTGRQPRKSHCPGKIRWTKVSEKTPDAMERSYGKGNKRKAGSTNLQSRRSGKMEIDVIGR